MTRLTDKVALITGAGAGIGEASAIRFAREGARVVAFDRDRAGAERVAESIRAAGGQAHALEGDVSRESDCARAVEWTKSECGAIHVLFNVAGVVDSGTLVDASEETLRRAFDINVMGMFFMSRLAVPIMIAQGGGSILNVGSVAGPHAVKDRGVYCVTKAAVFGLTKSLAIDFVGQGVRCNVICPGTVETPSWHARVRQADNPEEALKMFIARQPMGRVGQPEEIAALAAYLAADESSFMTGQAINIDGGMSM